MYIYMYIHMFLPLVGDKLAPTDGGKGTRIL